MCSQGETTNQAKQHRHLRGESEGEGEFDRGSMDDVGPTRGRERGDPHPSPNAGRERAGADGERESSTYG